MDYQKPEIKDYGDLQALTAGCLGGVAEDTFGTDPNFPAHPSGAALCP